MTVSELFNQTWEMLIGRAGGPMTFRLFIQPTVAAIYAIRAGCRDAREGRTAYLWALFAHRADRRRLIGQGWKEVRTLFIVATVLDVIYELIVYQWVYPVQALIVAVVLAIVPYLLIRGPVTRLIRRLRRR